MSDWQTTDEAHVPASPEGPKRLFLQRMVHTDGSVCFTIAQEAPDENTKFQAIVICAKQLHEIRRFFAGLKA
jgi:hypothetical protein